MLLGMLLVCRVRVWALHQNLRQGVLTAVDGHDALGLWVDGVWLAAHSLVHAAGRTWIRSHAFWRVVHGGSDVGVLLTCRLGHGLSVCFRVWLA